MVRHRMTGAHAARCRSARPGRRCAVGDPWASAPATCSARSAPHRHRRMQRPAVSLPATGRVPHQLLQRRQPDPVVAEGTHSRKSLARGPAHVDVPARSRPSPARWRVHRAQVGGSTSRARAAGTGRLSAGRRDWCGAGAFGRPVLSWNRVTSAASCSVGFAGGALRDHQVAHWRWVPDAHLALRWQARPKSASTPRGSRTARAVGRALAQAGGGLTGRVAAAKRAPPCCARRRCSPPRSCARPGDRCSPAGRSRRWRRAAASRGAGSAGPSPPRGLTRQTRVW